MASNYSTMNPDPRSSISVSQGPIYGQPGGYSGQPTAPNPEPPHSHVIPIQAYIPSGALTPSQTELIGLARATRWFAVIDIILCILYAFSGFGWIALVAMIGPIMGYAGGKQYRRTFVLFYMFFLILLIAFRILGLIFFYNTIVGLVLSILMIIIEIWIFRLVWRFHHLLRVVSQQEVDQARTLNHFVRPYLW